VDGPPVHITANTVLRGSWIQKRTRVTKDKLKRHCQERPSKIATYLDRGSTLDFIVYYLY